MPERMSRRRRSPATASWPSRRAWSLLRACTSPGSRSRFATW